ncbi:hypothetical protein [Nonomuraea sediminis]|uniref:hypothetical protein n=1 Tax=Nonomuraea sediminis TaxID=2835864 RepID=UPI001BDBFA2F|nr:hypothetical protein [Nonomuraea sediminis]
MSSPFMSFNEHWVMSDSKALKRCLLGVDLVFDLKKEPRSFVVGIDGVDEIAHNSLRAAFKDRRARQWAIKCKRDEFLLEVSGESRPRQVRVRAYGSVPRELLEAVVQQVQQHCAGPATGWGSWLRRAWRWFHAHVWAEAVAGMIVAAVVSLPWTWPWVR